MFNTSCEYVENNIYKINYTDINGLIDVINICYILFGLFITFFGYKYALKILTVLGFLPGFYGIFYITNIISGYVNLNCGSIFTFSLIGGLFTSLIISKILYLGYTLLGFMMGVSVGYFIYMIILNKIHIGKFYIYNNSFIVTELVFGITGAVYFTKKKNNFMIISTSLIGPYLFVKSLDKLIFQSKPKLLLDINNIQQDLLANVLYLITYMSLSMLGLYFQYKKMKNTSKFKLVDVTEPLQTSSLNYN
tara:strand:+ start:2096 stop:2842 length:747 start_codon:yes stop_codon:yes gene_type:complete